MHHRTFGPMGRIQSAVAAAGSALVCVLLAVPVWASELHFIVIEEEPFEGASHIVVPSLNVDGWRGEAPEAESLSSASSFEQDSFRPLHPASLADFNRYEAWVWFALAAVLAVYGMVPPSRIRKLGAVAVLLLLAFGFSDLVEARTGAWWRPWWLLLWKAFCVVGLGSCALLYYRKKGEHVPRPMDAAPLTPQPPPLPAAVADSQRPRLWRVTSISSIVLSAGLGLVLLPSLFFHQPLDMLEDPVGTLLHVAERDLDIDQAFQLAGPASRALYTVLCAGATDPRPEILDAYLRLDQYLSQWSEVEPWGDDEARPIEEERRQWSEDLGAAFAPDPFYWRYALLAADTGRENEALAALDKFNALQPGTDFASFLPEPIRRQALDPPAAAPHEFPATLQEIPDWSSDEVRIRAATMQGDTATASAIEAQRLARGRPFYRRCVAVAAAWCAPVGIGAACLATFLLLRRAPAPLSEGLIEARWSLRYGAQVLLRCLALAALLFAVLPESLLFWGTLWAGLPVLLLMELYLARPDASHVWNDLGLQVRAQRWPALVAVTLAVISVDQLGAMSIQLLAHAGGMVFPWEEALDETLLFGSTLRHMLSMIDGALWAPLFEEIAFRGLLYITLRRRLRPWPSALLASVLFSAVHLYSLVGFLEIFWTGLVLSFAYERWRSLWPCIAAHAFHNAIYFAVFSLVYRG